MKKTLLFIFFLISFCSYAQLDREHWFAPMVDRTGNTNQVQRIYMSTNETTPFKVDVYNNNVIIGSVTISKNNPAFYDISNSQRNIIIATTTTDLFKPVSKGIYLKGEKPFFASLRFSVSQHGEILTSKGTAGIGTEFRTVMAPITANNGILNFMTSVMATENNTSVTISDFNPTILFSDNIIRTQFNFVLNKGQSYIIDGSGNFISQNWTGFIGAKIVSDKPISITNGNFNGQYATTAANSSDILMDQGVPVNRLGQEFVLMKGNGTITSGMEKAIVVATEDGTEIYINGGTTPVATINAGQHYLTNNSAYLLQGFDHYNMRIQTNKNAYVYQLLAGDDGSSMVATGGFNYIPPLNCYLPKKIDEIGLIDENRVHIVNIGGFRDQIPTKLNIITERGATVDVKRNGTSLVLDASNGPFNVTGNLNWVTYSVADIYGNVAIFSSKAVTAGISAGDDAVGYGGYFAGFSSIPLITKTSGECLPGVRLEVTEGFDSYLWLLKVGTTYVPAPGVNNLFYYEPTQAGIYAIQVKQGSCPQIQTQDFKFYNCTNYTNYDYNSCGSETITPQFALSTQAVDPATVKLITPPTKGTVTIAADGKLTYLANPNVSGTDTFKFSFCGTDAIPDCETVQITVKMIEKNDALLEECSTNGTAIYNLTLANVTPDTTLTKSYFTTENGARNNIAAERITTFTNYSSVDKFVYVRLVNSFGCVAVAKIELKAKLAPEIKENLYTKIHCDEDIDDKIDGIYKVDLATITPIVLVQASNFIVKYYSDSTLYNNITGTYSFNGDTSIWIKVDAPNGCPTVIKEIRLKTGTKFTVNDPVTVFECDNNLNNSETTTLSKYTSLFTTDPSATVLFFNSLANAEANTPTTSDAQTITTPRTFYYRFKRPGFCEVIGTLNISLKPSTPTALLDSYTVCSGSSITLTAEAAPIYNKWEWKLGATIVSTTNTATLSAGVYTVSFTDASGCIFTKNITIVDSPKPQLNIATYNATLCDSNFDGNSDPVNFNTITPIIVTNFAANPGLFNARYYLNPADRDAGNSNTIPNLTNWTFSTNTTVYMRVESQYCTFIKGDILFKFGNNLSLITSTVITKECDDDLDGKKVVDLSKYISQFTTETGITGHYFNNLSDAQNNTNEIPNPVTIDQTGTYYLRLHKNNYCDMVVKITINIQIPLTSTVLVDKNICPETTTTLDAGLGFSGYLWSTGEITQEITVPVGEYWVDLAANGCTYRQYVSVKAVELPKIVSVEIKGSTVTVNVTGGNPPYQYAIDSGNYQPSNIFTNVRGGDHTISIISSDQCIPVTANINVIEIYNVITPNADGINDVLNYAALLTKEEPFIQIFDRYGKIIFTGDKNNQYSWDGKSFGKLVSTGSYWYVMKWKEPGFSTVNEYSGWVLVKNRE